MTLRRWLDPWPAPFALMAAIFVLSAQPDLSSGLGIFDLIGRKIAHMGMFALLCLLWWRALRTVVPPEHALALALGLSILYAVTDEYHQSFVPGRHGSPLDVAIDAVGAAATAVALRRRRLGAAVAGRGSCAAPRSRASRDG